MTRRDPPIRRLADALGAKSEVRHAPIPRGCTDGFCEAYYGRPEGLLDPGARSACSVWSFADDGVVGRFERELGSDLASGRWDARHGALRTVPEFDGSLRLMIGRPRSACHVTLGHVWCVLGAVASTNKRRTAVRGGRIVQG